MKQKLKPETWVGIFLIAGILMIIGVILLQTHHCHKHVCIQSK